MRIMTSVALLIGILGMTGCSPTTPEEEYVPGELVVSFTSEATEEEAKAVVERLNLTWKAWIESLKTGIVGVPVGEEAYWIEQLSTEALVVHAERHVYVVAQ